MNNIRLEQEISPALGRVAEEQLDRAHGTVLVVEDEDFVREVTCEVLLSAGYLVLRARTAVEATRLFLRNGETPQLLLTDVVLPGRSGHALAQDLRAISPGLKTIFISGYPENEITKQGLREPGMFYLPKPLSVEMLLERVKAVLRESGTACSEGTIAKHAWNSG